MTTQILTQKQPAEKCGKRNVYTGTVLSQVIGANQKAAENAAEAEAVNAAQKQINQDRNRQCPANCRPTVLGGNKKPKTKKILSNKIPQANQWVAYYTASWKVVIICPRPKKEKGQGNEEREQRQ